MLSLPSKVIETRYNGFLFRSRLEARWAVYFDALGIEYFYEHEGFDLGKAGWYLPDFYLPRVEMWAEVKPDTFSARELQKLKALVTFTQKPALMLIGVPKRKPYEAWCFDRFCKPTGLYRTDFILSNYHYQKESRFYGDPQESEVNSNCFNDIDAGVLAAKSARFQRRDEYDNRTSVIPFRY